MCIQICHIYTYIYAYIECVFFDPCIFRCWLFMLMAFVIYNEVARDDWAMLVAHPLQVVVAAMSVLLANQCLGIVYLHVGLHVWWGFIYEVGFKSVLSFQLVLFGFIYGSGWVCI